MKLQIFLIAIFTLFISNLTARPISYSGGITIMQKNNFIKNSLLLHYSPTYKYSIGYKGEYFKKEQIALNSLQLNNLVKRWNMPAAQANIYFKTNIGNASKSSQNQLYSSIGVAGDFETRKYFIAYENKYYKTNGHILSSFQQKMTLGIAPYIANYGQLHSWLMLQIDHQPKINGEELIIAPLLRIFKGMHLAELGVSSNKNILFNFIVRF